MADFDIITYKPGLILITRKALKYMSVHQAELGKTLTDDQKTCLQAAITAVAALLSCLVGGS